MAMRVAEQYLQAFGQLAKEGTTVLLPSSTHDPAAMVAQALTIFKQLGGAGGDPSRGGGVTTAVGGAGARGTVVDVGGTREGGGHHATGVGLGAGKGGAREGAHREGGRLASAAVGGSTSAGGEKKANVGFSLQKA